MKFIFGANLAYKVLATGSEIKASACNMGDPGSIPGSGRSPGEGSGNPLQHSYLEKSHGWRSRVGDSPWGHKELDTTEQLHCTATLNLVLIFSSYFFLRS